VTEPQIILGGDVEGVHNADLDAARARIDRSNIYRNLSTVIVIPTRGVVPALAVERWWNLAPAMNQPLVRMFVAGYEVGAAYEIAVSTILSHPVLQTFRYMLTLEEDNLPPADGLLRLYESMCMCDEPCHEHFAQVAGLYWTKGDGGMPMVYGDPRGVLAFNPQSVQLDTVQECNGTGMGFTLFHLGLFRAIEQPWFRTVQGPEGMGTQDLYFMGKVRRAGYRIASDNRVRVAHLDVSTGIAW